MNEDWYIGRPMASPIKLVIPPIVLSLTRTTPQSIHLLFSVSSAITIPCLYISLFLPLWSPLNPKILLLTRQTTRQTTRLGLHFLHLTCLTPLSPLKTHLSLPHPLKTRLKVSQPIPTLKTRQISRRPIKTRTLCQQGPASRESPQIIKRLRLRLVKMRQQKFLTGYP